MKGFENQDELHTAGLAERGEIVSRELVPVYLVETCQEKHLGNSMSKPRALARGKSRKYNMTKRNEKLIIDYRDKLLAKSLSVPEIHNLFKDICNADITGGKYARFLLDGYLNNTIRQEDLKGGIESTAGQSIQLFHKHKDKLPIPMRSVNKYSSPGDLWLAVKDYQDVISHKEEKKYLKEKVYKETEFIYRNKDNNFQIISPLTEESAKWWGKGTRWCTSADKNNMFMNYAEEAPLFILLMPNNDKIQLWKHGNDIQFMDEADNNVELEYIEEHWDILRPVCLWIGNLNYIPKQYRSLEVCQKAMQDIFSLNDIPDQYKTLDICLKSIVNNTSNIFNFPDRYKTKDIYKQAIKLNGLLLEVIPQEYKDKELCTLAIKQNPRAICYSDPDYLTQEICEEVIKTDGWLLKYIPDLYKTKELCINAIDNNIWSLDAIPIKSLSNDLYLYAINKDYNVLEIIPKSKRTKELCLAGLEQSPFALEFFHPDDLTQEICEYAVKRNGMAIQCIPDMFINQHLYNIAYEYGNLAIDHIPSQYRNKIKQKDKKQSDKQINCLNFKKSISKKIIDHHQDIYMQLQKIMENQDNTLSFQHNCLNYQI